MSLKIASRNALCFALILVQVSAFPAISIVQAQEADPESAQQAAATDSEAAPGTSSPEPQAAPPPATFTPPPPPAVIPPTAPEGPGVTGPTQPPGAASSTYTENPDGTWSNDQYTWDPVTKQTRPNKPQDYSYNPVTRMWDTTEYVYSPEEGKYIPNVRSTAVNPSSSARLSGTGPGSNNSIIAGTPGSYNINNTGPGSNNSINPDGTRNGAFDLFFNGSISNTIDSNSQSGNALVQGNTLGGDALSGDAYAMALLLNMLQSSWLGSSEIATFISNIDGDVYGDLLIDPNQLPYQVGSNNSDVDINISNNGIINNDVNLTAQSGDATVNGNTLGGDAKSGNAYAIANIINMINSSISAGRSFLGMININGNFNGDILLPPGVLEALIASTGANSTNTIGGTTNSDTTINSNANRRINNNIDATAASGDALVDSNTASGNGLTGSANTSTNTLNLAGQSITGKNGLLVFVNVLGRWVGLVIGPAATTATITHTGPDSTNTIGGDSSHSLTINAEENSLIRNDITVRTQSGDAEVSENSAAGSASSGNADSAVNLLNIVGGNIDVSDFFGVLFINVFGSWSGDFGNDSANGGFSQAAKNAGGQGGGVDSPVSATASSGQAPGGNNPAAQVFGFIAGGTKNTVNARVDQAAATNGSPTNNNTTIFGNSSGTPPDSSTGTSSAATAATISQMNWWLIVGTLGIIATLLVFGREYVLALREEKQLTASVK